MKLSKKLLLSLGFVGAGLVGSPSFSQNITNVKNATKSEVDETLRQKNSVHDAIIKEDITDLLKRYGNEKGMELIREHFLIEINNARAKIKSSAMKIDRVLNQIAQEHAQDMANNNYFDHEDSQGRHVWDRANEAGYQYSTISENIANDETIEEVISGFVNSKMGGHQSILSNEYQNLGIGIQTYQDNNKESDTYFVLDFSSPIK